MVGAIVSLSPAPEITDDLKGEFALWGPGKYDPRHHVFDGTDLITVFTPSMYNQYPARNRSTGR